MSSRIDDSVVWDWQGMNGDAQPLQIVQAGTGQSGTIALSTTVDEVLTNTKSLKLTQQTSSGAGNVKGRLVIPRPLGLPRMRVGVVYRMFDDDANFDYFQVQLNDNDGTNYRQAIMKQNSAEGVTEEIQYQNSAGALIDTGFTYPADQGNAAQQWYTLEMDVDLQAKDYTRLQFCNETDLVAKGMKELTASNYPSLLLQFRFQGDDTLCQVNIDSVYLRRLA